MPGVCHGATRPHAQLARAGGAAKPRPHGPGLRARGAHAAQQAQACHQTEAEEGKISRVIIIGAQKAVAREWQGGVARRTVVPPKVIASNRRSPKKMCYCT